MPGRRQELPDGIEMIGQDPQPQRTGVSQRVQSVCGDTSSPIGWRLKLGLLVGALMVAGALIAWRSGSESEPRFAVFGQATLDLSTAPDAEFPVFGRRWDQQLAFFNGPDIVTLDLNSGAQTRIGPVPCECEVADLGLVDGLWRIRTRFTVMTLVDDRWSATPDLPAGDLWAHRLLGSLVFSRAPNGAVQWLDLETGAVSTIEGTATVINRTLLEQDGDIIRRTDLPDSAPEIWAVGEFLAAGPNAVVWRDCQADPCRTWAGTVEEPQLIELDGITVDEVVNHEATVIRTIPDTVRYRVVSSDGRLATISEPEQTLVDLRNGDRSTLAGTAAFPRWDSTGRFLVVPTEPDALVVVDVRSAMTATIRRAPTSQDLGFNPAVFLPPE